MLKVYEGYFFTHLSFTRNIWGWNVRLISSKLWIREEIEEIWVLSTIPVISIIFNKMFARDVHGQSYFPIMCTWCSSRYNSTNLERSKREKTNKNPSPFLMYCSLIALNSWKWNKEADVNETVDLPSWVAGLIYQQNKIVSKYRLMTFQI